MNLIEKISGAVAALPDYVTLLVSPVLILAAAVVFLLLRRPRGYLTAVPVLLALALFFGAAEGEGSAVLVYFSLNAVWAFLWNIVLHLPAKKQKKSKADCMYEKFHVELEAPYLPEEKKDLPPKVCCFDEERKEAQEGTQNLEYALSLGKKLKSANLSAGDRLELDALLRTLETYGNRPMSEAEMERVNDCLASVLRLTAKYRL